VRLPHLHKEDLVVVEVWMLISSGNVSQLETSLRNLFKLRYRLWVMFFNTHVQIGMWGAEGMH
jgi:hypothetical protein